MSVPRGDDLRLKLKAMLVCELMLEEEPGDIGDDTAIFDPEGLGLDSVDALQLVVALEKHFGLKIENAEMAQGILQSVASIAHEIEQMPCH